MTITTNAKFFDHVRTEAGVTMSREGISATAHQLGRAIIVQNQLTPVMKPHVTITGRVTRCEVEDSVVVVERVGVDNFVHRTSTSAHCKCSVGGLKNIHVMRGWQLYLEILSYLD